MKKCGMVKTYFAEVDYMEGIWIDWKLGTQVKRPANTTELAEGRTGLSFIFSCDKYHSLLLFKERDQTTVKASFQLLKLSGVKIFTFDSFSTFVPWISHIISFIYLFI